MVAVMDVSNYECSIQQSALLTLISEHLLPMLATAGKVFAVFKSPVI